MVVRDTNEGVEGKYATLIRLSQLLQNSGGQGRDLVNAFSKVSAATDSEAKENADITSWFLNDYFPERSKVYEAIVGSVVGTLCMTIFGTLFNAVYLLPTFAVMFGMPLEAIIGMGTELNSNITNVFTFVAFCVAPLNLLKGSGVSILTFLLYKPLSPILKAAYDNTGNTAKNRQTEGV